MDTDEVHDLIETERMHFVLSGLSGRKLKRSGEALVRNFVDLARFLHVTSVCNGQQLKFANVSCDTGVPATSFTDQLLSSGVHRHLVGADVVGIVPVERDDLDPAMLPAATACPPVAVRVVGKQVDGDILQPPHVPEPYNVQPLCGKRKLVPVVARQEPLHRAPLDHQIAPSSLPFAA